MKNKGLLILFTLLLTSCGSSLSSLIPYKVDHSASWNDNYYSYFDQSLLNKTVVKKTLDKYENKVFTSYQDMNFRNVEPNYNSYSYEDDWDSDIGYGPHFKLSNINNEVKEGFVSKLFDGQLFCHGYYEKARIQINESGFSSSFYHELESASYLYLNFKSAIDFKSYKSVMEHTDDVTINITFYSDKAYQYSYSLTGVPANYSEGYVFYGFSLEGLNIKGARDFSISYKLDYDIIKDENPDVAHALLLYEFGLVNAVFK